MAGYSILILKKELDRFESEKYKCNHCNCLLKDPCQTYCGHRFCKFCIDQLISETGGSYECSICGPDDITEENPGLSIITSTKVFRDKAIKREMRNLKTKCINTDCIWQGNFEDYQKHETDCEHRLISCQREGCHDQMKQKDITTHLKTGCLLRNVNCQYCKHATVVKDLENHFSRCPEMKVPCEFCGQKVIRKKMQEHMNILGGDCPKKMQRCKFHTIGCDKMVELGKESEHNALFIQNHLDLVFRQVAALINLKSHAEENTRNVRELQVTIRHYEDLISKTQRSLNQLERDLKDQQRLAESQAPNNSTANFKQLVEKLTKSQKELETKSQKMEINVMTYENIVVTLNQEVERSAEMVQTLVCSDRRLRERLDALEKKAKAQDRIIALKDVTLAEQDLRIQSLEMASYDGILTWKISEFNRKRRDAISGRTLSLYSPYFFSGQFGYKLCARIYLNGDGMGKGNHISLFFVVMKGEFDAILRWPFRQKVTFMWIDQNNREHMIDAFRPDPNSSSFKRPTGDMNIASGCPLFMPLSMLEDSKHAYVKDDTAFLRIIVDTHDL